MDRLQPRYDAPSTEDAEAGDLGFAGRDSEVLRVIEQEELTGFSFEGLKRRTGTHPETLSRVLARLEDSDILERFQGAYRVTEKGRERLRVHPLNYGVERLTLVRTMLPPSVRQNEILSGLKGKWFGQLRWLGFSETPSDMVLKWVTADGKVQLDARIGGGELTIEGRVLEGNDVAGAVRASHQLMSHIAGAYLGPRSGRAYMMKVSPTSFMPN